MAAAAQIEDFSALPGSDPDPEPRSTAYFVVWGFALVLLIALALQYVVYAVTQAEAEVKAHGSVELRQLETSQRQLLETGGAQGVPIEKAMQRVVQEYRR